MLVQQGRDIIILLLIPIFFSVALIIRINLLYARLILTRAEHSEMKISILSFHAKHKMLNFQTVVSACLRINIAKNMAPHHPRVRTFCTSSALFPSFTFTSSTCHFLPFPFKLLIPVDGMAPSQLPPTGATKPKYNPLACRSFEFKMQCFIYKKRKNYSRCVWTEVSNRIDTTTTNEEGKNRLRPYYHVPTGVC